MKSVPERETRWRAALSCAVMAKSRAAVCPSSSPLAQSRRPCGSNIALMPLLAPDREDSSGWSKKKMALWREESG